MHLRRHLVQSLDGPLNGIQFRRRRFDEQQAETIVERQAAARLGQVHADRLEKGTGCDADVLHLADSREILDAAAVADATTTTACATGATIVAAAVITTAAAATVVTAAAG